MISYSLHYIIILILKYSDQIVWCGSEVLCVRELPELRVTLCDEGFNFSFLQLQLLKEAINTSIQMLTYSVTFMISFLDTTEICI